MRARKMLWQLFPSYLVITVISLLVLALYAASSLRSFYFDRTAEVLEVRGRFVARQIGRISQDESEAARIDSLCKLYGNLSETRITLILPSGMVLGDTDEDPSAMNNHADRPEVRSAMAGKTGRSVRYSHTLQKSMMYLALPLERNGTVVGVIRTAMPLSLISGLLSSLYWKIALGAMIVLLAMFGVSLWVFKRINRPLEQLRNGAEMFARGELDRRIPLTYSLEVDELAETMNRMSAMLSERIAEITSQRNELESLLAGMTEGVIVVDLEERIVRINAAAGHLFGVVPENARGRMLQEVIRNFDLQRFTAMMIESGAPAEGEVAVHFGETHFLLVHGTFLPDGGQRNILLVLNDVTRTRRLENIRREFVSNVSHELKTPITSIKGFVETLLGGAMKDPADLERFLRIILKHTDRLNAIIEDILDLSRIEQEGERREIERVRARLRPVLSTALQNCRPKIEAKSLDVVFECPEDLEARLSADLLELAVVNLLDNAIKYSEPGGRIELHGVARNGRIEIRVVDNGPGIEKKHLERIFERFYRVDKARSRNLGGTGLGLSIVKHISQVHDGRVEVQSEPGRGSTFIVSIPAD